MFVILLVLIQFVFLTLCKIENAPFVKIKQGALKGKHWKTEQGRTFAGFTGIPFGKPPIGDLRFKAPEPAESWEGILDASDVFETCPQINIFSKDYDIVGQEDCLYLSVYTHQVYASKEYLLPVIFYIHGGSFLIGSGSPDWISPEILMDRNIVLVVANYRLGALGFLSVGNKLAPGNNGLKDQTLALQWIKENIVNFGGDANKITVAGNSAGGASAHFHMLSPLSKDLISGVIAQSGSAIHPFAISGNVEAFNNAYELGDLLNCSSADSEQLIDCLKYADAYAIVAQQSKLTGWDNDTTISPFRPVIELDTDGAFLAENPLRIIQTGSAANIPLMTGMVSQEGAYKSAGLNTNEKLLKIFNRYFDMIVTTDFRIVSDGNTISQALKIFYFDDRDVDSSTKSELTNMYTDGWFLWSLDHMASLHAKISAEPIYLYLFEYKGSVSYGHLFGDPTFDYGVCHTDDLLYLLPRTNLFPNYAPTDSDTKMSEIMTTLWENFARTGNPTLETNSIIPVKWEPVQSQYLEYFHIKNYSDISMTSGLYWNRTQFWRNIPVQVVGN